MGWGKAAGSTIVDSAYVGALTSHYVAIDDVCVAVSEEEMRAAVEFELKRSAVSAREFRENVRDELLGSQERVQRLADDGSERRDGGLCTRSRGVGSRSMHRLVEAAFRNSWVREQCRGACKLIVLLGQGITNLGKTIHVNSSCCDGRRCNGGSSSGADTDMSAGAHSTSEGRGPGGSDSDVPGRDDQGGDQS